MASFTSHLSLHTGPAAYSSRKRLTYAMSSGPHFTRSKAIVLSLKNSHGKIPLELSGKQLRFLGRDQITRRCGSVQIPVIKAAAEEPSSAPAEEDPNLPILLSLDWYLFSTLLRIFTRKIYIYFPFPYFVSVAQLAVGVTLCIMNWSLGFHNRAVSFFQLKLYNLFGIIIKLVPMHYYVFLFQPINKDLLTVIAPIACFHTIVHLLFNSVLNSEVVRPVSLINKVLEPFDATFGYLISRFGFWIFRDSDFFLQFWMFVAVIVIGGILSLTCRNIYSKQAMKRMDSTNVYAYVSIISLFFCIPLALHMEGPTMLYQLSRAIAKNGMVTILYDFLLMGVLYYRCNKVATENLRRVNPVAFTVGIIFENVCAMLFSKC